MVNIISVIAYLEVGYSTFVLIMWLLSIIVISISFFEFKIFTRYQKASVSIDLQNLLLLFILFFSIYFLFLYNIPHQINTDESVIMSYQKVLTSNENIDIFAISSYFDFPAFIFIVTGHLANLLGGVGLLNSRIIHAASGMLIILFGYLFFRSLKNSKESLFMAVLLGFSHSLIGLSRMAMRDNTSLLFSLIALNFLVRGQKSNNNLFLFLGGIICGISFYSYLPGAVTIFIWSAVMFVWYLTKIENKRLFYLAKNFSVVIVGVFMALSPLLVAMHKKENYGEQHYKKQILIFEEGLQLQKEWFGLDSYSDAYVHNIKNYFSTFVLPVSDKAYIYSNDNVGFTDPITGIMLIIGSIYLLFFKKQTRNSTLIITSFIFLSLVFAFFINKAPNFTRMLVLLPYIVYISYEGIKLIAKFFEKIFKKKFLSTLIIIFIIIFISLLNGYYYVAYVKHGIDYGETHGDTIRYVLEKKDKLNYSFFVMADKDNMYYPWGESDAWYFWVNNYVAENQNVKIISPNDEIKLLDIRNNFTIFTIKSVYQKIKPQLDELYINYKVINLTKSGNVAIEVN